MLFNSYLFIFGFLPVVLTGFYLLGERRREWALLWLTAASLAFYAWWRPVNVLLIAPSILINYGLSRALQRTAETRPALAKAILIVGIAFNVCFLGYFKYRMFFEGALNDAFGAGFILARLILPLGISFITFQKIAFLVDVHAGRVSQFSLRDYGLFVLFFPQLIAGPIVHYREMMPQFRAVSCRFDATDMSVGLTLFSFGLVKKLLLADPLGNLVSPIYSHAAAGIPQSMTDGWIAALGFTLQIYFDFSGYTDMALGLARLFGIKLPVNFNSPLKARSIVDFWLRWHVSLTRFLTAYIYNPLTLSLTRRRVAHGKAVFGGRNTTVPAFLVLLAMPTILTMLISGLWHGAGYTFILWGLLHGLYLCVNHAWRVIRPRIWPNTRSYNQRMAPAGVLVTFVSVVFAMVLFRAPTVGASLVLWKGMAGIYGVVLPHAILANLGSLGHWLQALGVQPAWTSGSLLVEATVRIVVLLAIALMAPNTLEMLACLRARPRGQAGESATAAATSACLDTEQCLGRRACLRHSRRRPLAGSTERIPLLAVLMGSPQRFLRVWLMAVAALAVAVVTINLAVDPYEVFGTPRTAGISAVKPRTEDYAMLAKTYQIARVHPVSVLIGSSFVDVGIDASDPQWPQAMRPVYNYGIPGSSVFDGLRTLQEAAATGVLKNAIVFLSFEDFIAPEPHHRYPRKLSGVSMCCETAGLMLCARYRWPMTCSFRSRPCGR